jgi:hypothetical protein
MTYFRHLELKVDLFKDFLPSINQKTKHLMDDIETAYEAEKDYNPYIINRCMSSFPDTLMHAQAMNLRSALDNRMQYDYYYYAVRSRKRYSKWLKKEDNPDLDLVKRYFGYSNAKAKEVLKILSENDLNYIREMLDPGQVENIKVKKEKKK